MSLETARTIADAILYEGYILYPYRASHGKNRSQVRWQFGVLVPQAFARANPLPPGSETLASTRETTAAAILPTRRGPGSTTVVSVTCVPPGSGSRCHWLVTRPTTGGSPAIE